MDVSQRRILLVDDDAMCRKAYSRALRQAGFDVLVAPDGPNALRMFRAAMPPPDAVVLDLDMPELSGEETFRMLRMLDPTLSVVVLTGHAADPRIDEMMAAGAIEHLNKPCPLPRLIEVVSEASRDAFEEEEMATGVHVIDEITHVVS